MLPTSPSWPSSIVPCEAPVGFHGPPAVLASSELQSPTSWSCTPCLPMGTTSATSRCNVTSHPDCVNVAEPVAMLPLLARSIALAVAAGCSTQGSPPEPPLPPPPPEAPEPPEAPDPPVEPSSLSSPHPVLASTIATTAHTHHAHFPRTARGYQLARSRHQRPDRRHGK